MKERHQDEVRSDLVVRGGAEKRLSVLAPEGNKGGKEPLRVERSLGSEPRGPDGRQGILRSERQHPGDDLAVDRIRDDQSCRWIASRQTEVHDELPVVVGGAVNRGPRQDRLDHLPNARLPKAFRETVEMGVLPRDQDLLCGVDVLAGDGGGGIGDDDLEDLASERIDEPGLPLGEVESAFKRPGRKLLAGLCRVLTVELGDLLRREGTEGEGLDLDVERAGALEMIRSARGGLVVANVQRRSGNPSAGGDPAELHVASPATDFLESESSEDAQDVRPRKLPEPMRHRPPLRPRA